MLHGWGRQLRFIRKVTAWSLSIVAFGQSGYYLHRCKGTRLCFLNCYIEGTTDFIFGPSTALFHNCTIHSKANSYITAASTPKDIEVGYVFKNCKLTAAPDVDKVYLGRPWRPYAATVFINCEMGKHICPAGWDNWRNPENEKQPVMLNMVIRERGLIIQIG